MDQRCDHEAGSGCRVHAIPKDSITPALVVIPTNSPRNHSKSNPSENKDWSRVPGVVGSSPVPRDGRASSATPPNQADGTPGVGMDLIAGFGSSLSTLRASFAWGPQMNSSVSNCDTVERCEKRGYQTDGSEHGRSKSRTSCRSTVRRLKECVHTCRETRQRHEC